MESRTRNGARVPRRPGRGSAGLWCCPSCGTHLSTSSRNSPPSPSPSSVLAPLIILRPTAIQPTSIPTHAFIIRSTLPSYIHQCRCQFRLLYLANSRRESCPPHPGSLIPRRLPDRHLSRSPLAPLASFAPHRTGFNSFLKLFCQVQESTSRHPRTLTTSGSKHRH